MKQSKHIVEKRRNKIVELLQQMGEMPVNELGKHFSVSPLTIRRDLSILEERGVIDRTYGGACLKKVPDALSVFSDKENVHHSEKELIARYVLSYIQDGNTIFMNSGTTMLELFKLLDNRYVNIVTNNMLAYQYCPNILGNLIYTGGTYMDETKACIGDFAVNTISQIYSDLCILGANGINAVCGVTTPILQETIVNVKMIERCNGKVIVIADSSKVGKTFSFTSAKIDDVDILITGIDADPVELDKIRNAGVEVHLVSEEDYLD